MTTNIISLQLWFITLCLSLTLKCYVIPSLQSTKAVYNRILDLKIASPQIIFNYGLFLEENKYYEEAFKVA